MKISSLPQVMLVACSLAALANAQITAPLPESGELGFHFKLVQSLTIHDTSVIPLVSFGASPAQIYALTWLSSDDDATCKDTCHDVILYNVVSGNVRHSVRFTLFDAQLTALSIDASLAFGESRYHRPLVGSNGTNKAVFSLDSGEVRQLFELDKGAGNSAASFSFDKKYLGWLVDQTAIVVLDLKTRKQIARLVADDHIYHFTFSPDSQRIIAACEDGTIRIWSVSTGKSLHVFDVGAGPFGWAWELPDQATIIGVTKAGAIIRIGSGSGKVSASSLFQGGAIVASVTCVPGVVESVPGTVASPGGCVQEQIPSLISVSPDGKLLTAVLASGGRYQIDVLNTQLLAPIATIWSSTSEGGTQHWSPQEIRFSSDGGALLAAGRVNDSYGLVRVWRVESVN